MKRFGAKLIAYIFLAPIATLWVNAQEKRIINKGTTLDDEQQSWARQIGIQQVEQIRIIREPSLAFPAPQWLAKFFAKRGMGLNNAAGMSLRYGIFISSHTSLTQHLLCHELTHTLQYERAGTIYHFLCQYIFECIHYGYPNAPMENEANSIADQCSMTT